MIWMSASRIMRISKISFEYAFVFNKLLSLNKVTIFYWYWRPFLAFIQNYSFLLSVGKKCLILLLRNIMKLSLAFSLVRNNTFPFHYSYLCISFWIFLFIVHPVKFISILSHADYKLICIILKQLNKVLDLYSIPNVKQKNLLIVVYWVCLLIDKKSNLVFDTFELISIDLFISYEKVPYYLSKLGRVFCMLYQNIENLLNSLTINDVFIGYDIFLGSINLNYFVQNEMKLLIVEL